MSSWLAKNRKCDLITAISELDLTLPANTKVVNLCKTILDDENYEEDLVRNLLVGIVAEREETERQEQERVQAREGAERADRIRLEEAERAERREQAEREFQLQKLQVELEANKAGATGTNTAIKSRDLIKLLSSYKTDSDISVYLSLFERQVTRAGIVKENWVSFLISLLPLEIVNLIAREPDTIANDYEEVKKLLIRRFKLNFEQFRQKFIFHKKDNLSSYRDFGFELTNYFEEWIKGLDITTFDDLKELIITDQLKKRLPADIKEHFVDKLPKIKKLSELITKLEDYETARNNIRKPREVIAQGGKTGRPFGEKSGRSFGERSDQAGSSTKPYNTYTRPLIKCHKCFGEGHKAYQCVKRENRPSKNKNKQPDNRNKPLENRTVGSTHKEFSTQKESNMTVNCDVHVKDEKVHQNVDIRGKRVNSLIDTGSDITIISSDFHREIGSPELINDGSNIQGITGRRIKPLGFFITDIEIEGKAIQAKIYVLQELCREMVLGAGVVNKLHLFLEKGKLRVLDEPPPGKVPEGRLAPEERKVTVEKDQMEIFLAKIAKGLDLGEIDFSHILDKKVKEELVGLVTNYKPNKTKDTQVKMHIILKDDIPVNQRPRRLAMSEREIVKTQVQEWLRDGIIRESCSDFSAAVVLCKKKGGGHRVCIDYRPINKKIVRDRYPLPLIEDVIDQLEQAVVFTSLDLKNGFFHVGVDEQSTKYTSFVTQEGQYEFLKVPFGLCTSPNVFQRYIFHVFRDLVNEKVVTIYMDDMIITSKDEKEGIAKLKRVLERAAEYGLELNFGKCQFLKRKIEFLGYTIEKGTIKPSPAKTEAVQNFPTPKTVKGVQSFLGLTGYFRKFIPNYSKIAKPLSDLLRGNVEFQMGSEQLEAVQRLKEALTQAPVLHIFQQGANLELHTDASSQGFGAVLFQQDDEGKMKPLQYMSRKTTPQQEKYNSYELEVLAIVEALKKFRSYLIGTKFKIVTDCEAFKRTLNKRELAPRVARWALFLEEFEYEVVHRPGKQMSHVDALSRNTILLVTQLQDEVTAKIAAAQDQDEHLEMLKELVRGGEKGEHFLRNEVLYKYVDGRELLVIPHSMQTQIIQKIHNQGHFAAAKMEEVLKQSYYIPKARGQVEKVISNCVKCILCNRKRRKGEGLLNPIPKEDTPLSTYHVDHIGPLATTSKKYQHVLTVIDAFTKFTWLYPCKTTSTQEAISKLQAQQTVFGNPSRIISDKGSAFNSKDFADYCQEQNIEHIQVTTGVPRGNGQVERIHNTIIPVLAKLSFEDPTKWYRYVTDLQRVLNSTTSVTTKYTPFELMIGVKMKNQTDQQILGILEDENLQRTLADRNQMRETAKTNILAMQQQNKRQYDKRRKKPHKYKVGDLVAIKRTQFGAGLKLKLKFFGPYRIKKVKYNDRYDVEKVGNHEGPHSTSVAADGMKIWSDNIE